MSSFQTRAVFFVVVFGTVLLSSARAASNDSNNIAWSDFTPSERESDLQTEFDDQGLMPWFNLAVSFSNTVLNKEPYDLMVKAKDGELGEPQELATGYFLGLIITAGIGILFCILMPIVGFCFCCCRCCGRCGGEMTWKEGPRDACKRAVFGIVLSIITLLMLVGVLLTFVCNNRMSDTADRMKDTTYGILDEAVGFVNDTVGVRPHALYNAPASMNDTVGEFDAVLTKDFPEVTKRISDDINDAGVQKLVGDPLLEILKKGTIGPLEKVKELSENTNKMDEQLTLIQSNTMDLRNESKLLEKNLTDIENDLAVIRSNCSALPLPLSDCANIGKELAADANFSTLPDVDSQLENIRNVANQDFAGSAQEGIDTLTDIPKTIINKTSSARKDVVKMVANATQLINDYKKDLDKVVDDNIVKAVNDAKNSMEEPFDLVKQYDKYRWYAGIGLACILLLIVLLLALGLICGICGHDKSAMPSARGSVSNMGGMSLMAAVGFCFIFSFLLMLLTTICFLIGTPMQWICGTVQSGEIYSQFVDNPKYWDDSYIFAKTVYNKSNAPVTVGGLLKNCREDQPAYRAASVHLVFNVSDKLNIKKLLGDSIDQQFDNMKVNLSDQTILTNETRTSLDNLINAGVEDINFDQFLNETSKEITNVDLKELAKNLTKLAADVEGVSLDLAKRMNATADKILLVEQTRVQSMKTKSDELDKNVKDLQGIGDDLKNLANDTLLAAEKAEDYLHSQASAEITGIVKDYTDRVLGYGYQFSDRIVDLLTNEMGKCKPIANIVDATVVVLCNDFLYPFNGFWLAIGWCLFFFIPAIIFAVKLAKHYRRMKYDSDFDYDDYEMQQPRGAPPPYNGIGHEKKVWNGNTNF